jgi:hypothetical protein
MTVVFTAAVATGAAANIMMKMTKMMMMMMKMTMMTMQTARITTLMITVI